MRPIHKTISPTALDRNGIAAAQTVAAGGYFALTGALTLTQLSDRDGIATAQTPAGAGSLTLDGAVGVGFDQPTYVTIYAGNDESGKTFTVTGWVINGDYPERVTETITGPNAAMVIGSVLFSGIESVKVSAATTGNVEVGVPGIATFATPQHVTAFAAGDESGDVITVTGTDREGRIITDTITGVNNTTVATTKNFATVTKVSTDGAVTSMEIGVDGTCESAWWPMNTTYGDFNVSLGMVISSGGALTYTVQHTLNDVQASGFDEDSADPFNHATLAAQTASNDGTYASPVSAVRVAITAHTSGSLAASVIQAGN